MVLHLDSDEELSPGNIYTNATAEGGIRLDLPSAQEGATLAVVVHAPHRVLIVAEGPDQIFLGTASGAGAEADTIGSHLSLTCTKAGRWTSLFAGAWTITG